MKKSLTILFITLISLNFISAYYYGSSSLGDILDQIDASTAILGALFLIAFIFLNFALEKYLKNKTISAVASFAIAFLIIYVLNKNVDVYSFIYNLGWYSEEFSWIFLLIFAGIFVITGFSYGWGIAMIVLGFLSIFAGIIDFLEMSFGMVLGIILIGIGAWIKSKTKDESLSDKLDKLVGKK